jgi:hypothetical protein
MVAAMEAKNPGAGIDLTATMNASLIGAISKTARQIDLLVESRWRDGRFRRIMVDAKHHARPLTVNDVEMFLGMMDDCGAELGFLVCPNGCSKAAERRAQEPIILKLLTLEDAKERTDWAAFGDCYGRCSNLSDRRRRGVVLWAGQLPLAVDNLWASSTSVSATDAGTFMFGVETAEKPLPWQPANRAAAGATVTNIPGQHRRPTMKRASNEPS